MFGNKIRYATLPDKFGCICIRLKKKKTLQLYLLIIRILKINLAVCHLS